MDPDITLSIASHIRRLLSTFDRKGDLTFVAFKEAWREEAFSSVFCCAARSRIGDADRGLRALTSELLCTATALFDAAPASPIAQRVGILFAIW